MKLSADRRRVTWLIAATGVVAGVVLLLRSPRRHALDTRAAAPTQRQIKTNAVPFTAPSKPGPISIARIGEESRVSEILSQLESGQDAPTVLGFKIGPHGKLVSAPTRRAALLDELARLDPKAAGAVAEKILGDFGSPDEWALSLRIYALANTDAEAKSFLAQKLQAMLEHAPWQ